MKSKNVSVAEGLLFFLGTEINIISWRLQHEREGTFQNKQWIAGIRGTLIYF
jgi:hypothetical protein